jgi:AcrR family transcriptional regulator
MAARQGDEKGRRGLPRGPQALPRAEVMADQRGRLLQALVELVDEHGWAGVRVAELVARAGVSRRSFYEHFENKQECLLAAFDVSVQRLTERIAKAYDPHMEWQEQVRAIVGAVFAATLERPNAMRLVCVDVGAAGPTGVARWGRGAAQFELFLREVFARAPGEGGIPEPVAKAVVGALRKIIYSRVAEGQSGRALRAELDKVLPEVVAWISSYYPSPPEIPMRPRRQRTAGGSGRNGQVSGQAATRASEQASGRASRPARGPVGGRAGGRAPGTLATLPQGSPRGLPHGDHNLPRGFVEHNQRERIFDALANLTAEHGYPALGLEDVAAQAAVSLQTFYSHFDSKEEAFVAMYEVGHARTVAVCEEAFAAAESWTEGVRAAMRALLEFLAAEPAYAHVSCVDIVVAFPRLTERVVHASGSYAELLDIGMSNSDGAPSVASEAIVGGVFELLHDYVARGLTERLPELTDHATYIALAPFIGNKAAAAAVAGPRRARA